MKTLESSAFKQDIAKATKIEEGGSHRRWAAASLKTWFRDAGGKVTLMSERLQTTGADILTTMIANPEIKKAMMKGLGDRNSFIGKQLGAETCSKVMAAIGKPAKPPVASGNSLRKRARTPAQRRGDDDNDFRAFVLWFLIIVYLPNTMWVIIACILHMYYLGYAHGRNVHA
jgi:hypothetical protein